MLSDTAPMSYRQRVAREKERIQTLMQAQEPALREAWNRVRVARRFAFCKDTELYLWEVGDTGKSIGSLHVVSAKFDFNNGFSATVRLTDKWLSGTVKETFNVGRTPVRVSDNVFVVVDCIEPFVQRGDDMLICLVVYSGASPVGAWLSGTVAGTKEEFENYEAC